MLAVSSCMRSEQRRLLKPAEVAAQLGVSRTWLYEAAKTGRIPAIRIGGREGPLRFVPEDLQRWIDDARAEWVPGRHRRPIYGAFPCARVDSNHHGPYGPQGPQPDTAGVDGSTSVQVVHFAWFSGRIGRAGRYGRCHGVATASHVRGC
ncbi:MAG: helix-turn-helix transcriptional regulator [Solirubrobacteraceae bacterium]